MKYLCNEGCFAVISGMYSSILSEAEITLPKKVTSDGKHLSHDTTHYHDGQPVYYNITLTNKDHFLILHPEENFLAPAIIIERHKRDSYVRTKPQVTSTKCHYRGIVHGQPNSAVALSSCNGLVFIYTFISFFHQTSSILQIQLLVTILNLNYMDRQFY